MHPVEWRAAWQVWADDEQRKLDMLIAQERAADYRCLTLYCLLRNIHRAKGERAITPEDILRTPERSEEVKQARQFFERLTHGRNSSGYSGRKDSR